MKRKDIIKKLSQFGFVFEGANHTKVYDASGVYRCAIGRHTEISEVIVRLMEKQTGLKLK